MPKLQEDKMTEAIQLKYFRAYELVSKQMFELFGNGSLRMFSPDVLKSLDQLRSYFGRPIYINSFMHDRINGRQWSGLRSVKCPVGATMSAHKMGTAFDLHCQTEDELAELSELIREYGRHFRIHRVEHYEHTLSREKGMYIHVEFGATMADKVYYFHP